MCIRDRIEIAEQAKEMGTLCILLTGGEPFLQKDFKELYIKLYNMGFILSINTNATLITEKEVEWLKTVSYTHLDVYKRQEHIQYINLSSAADLYYEITPNEDGNVVIENMTDNLLSITKVRITSKNATTIKNSLISTPELMSYVEKFDSLSVKQDNNKDDSLSLIHI